MTALFAGSTAIVITRPDVTAGPIDRALRPVNVSAANGDGDAGRGACADTTSTRAATATAIAAMTVRSLMNRLVVLCERGRQTPADLSAASTRADLNGTRRRRTPVASWIAFATAAIIGLHDVSPAP